MHCVLAEGQSWSGTDVLGCDLLSVLFQWSFSAGLVLAGLLHANTEAVKYHIVCQARVKLGCQKARVKLGCQKLNASC